MSNDKRIREMLERLVAMTPDPPPYPEEITMARHETPRRPRPALMFAGAAAIVIALAVPVILLTGGENPDAVGTTLPTPVSSTTPSSTEPSPTSSTVPITQVWSGVVYLHQTPENGRSGNPALVPVTISVAGVDPGAQFTAALTALADQGSFPPGLESSISPDVQLMELSTTTVDGEEVWVADMNERFLEGGQPTGLLSDFTMLNQIVYTITGPTAIDSVLFTVNGQPVTEFGTDGLGLTDPISRNDESYLDNLANIFLTAPLIEGDGVYTVEGLARVFEGNLVVRVLDSTGAPMDERIVTATCGGCWGEFREEIPADLIEPGASSIQILTFSALDGSEEDVITVPIPPGDVWELIPADQ